MFRYASVSSINSFRSLCTNTARNNILKCKPQLMTSSSNYLLLSRSESTGTGSFSYVSSVHASAVGGSDAANVGKSTASISTQVDPSVLNVTDSSSSSSGSGVGDVLSSAGGASSAETLVDPAAAGLVNTLNEQVQFIPDAPAIPLEQIETIVTALAANGEPTLRSLGLASNWPSGLVQQALEYLHCDLGLPWWGAIVAGTVVIRLILSPLVVKSQQQAAKMNNNMPQMQVLQVKMTEARQSGNALMAAKYGNDMSVFMKEKDMNPLKSLLVPLCQAPIFVSCFFGLRAMANLPVDSLKTGGMLWFQDLTLADPFYILPLVTCATLFITLEIGAEGARIPNSSGGQVMKYVMRAIPIVVFPFTMNFPAALLCYWATTNVVSLGQVLLLRIPTVRAKLNIEKKLVHDPDNLPVTSKGFKASFKDSWDNIKITREMDSREDYDSAIFKRAGRAPITKTYRYDPTKAPPSSSTSTIKTIHAKSIKPA